MEHKDKSKSLLGQGQRMEYRAVTLRREDKLKEKIPAWRVPMSAYRLRSNNCELIEEPNR